MMPGRGWWLAAAALAVMGTAVLLFSGSSRSTAPRVRPHAVSPREAAARPAGLSRGGAAETLAVLGAVPAFSLTAQDGRELGLEALQGCVWVADFFFTRCAGICPLMSNQLRRIQEAFRGNPRVKLVSFTVDPGTDTVEILARYAQSWGAEPGQWHFVTGDRPAIYDLARQGFKLSAAQGDAGPRDFIHSDRFVLVDRQGRIRGYYHGTEAASVDRLMEDVRRLLPSPS